MIWLLPPVLQVSSTGDTPKKGDNLLTEEGEEPNLKSARKLGPLCIIQYSLYTVQYTSINVTSVRSHKHYCMHVQVNKIYNEGAYLSIRKRVLDSCNSHNSYWIIYNKIFFTGTANALKFIHDNFFTVWLLERSCTIKLF